MAWKKAISTRFCLHVSSVCFIHQGTELFLMLHRLHMLSELEDYFHVCHNFSASSSDSSEPLVQSSREELLRQWNCRLQMVQVKFMLCELCSAFIITLLLFVHVVEYALLVQLFCDICMKIYKY